MSPPAFDLRALAGALTLSAACAGSASADPQQAGLFSSLDGPTVLVARQAVQNALENLVTGESQLWEVAGVAGGAVTPLRTYRSTSGHWCREFEARTLFANGESHYARAVKCRGSDGFWNPVEG